MSDRIPGSSWSNPIWHRGWRICIGEPNTHRSLAYEYVHDDYDGAEDANDHRCGHAASIEEAKHEIDLIENERDPSELEHEADQLARYTAHEEELERNYVGPKEDRE